MHHRTKSLLEQEEPVAVQIAQKIPNNDQFFFQIVPFLFVV